MPATQLAISVKQASNRYRVSQEELIKLVSMRRIPGFVMRERLMLLRVSADEFFSNRPVEIEPNTEQFEFDF